MRIRFKLARLEDLYTLRKGASRYPREVIEKYIDVVTVIQDAVDEQALYALKSLHYEKLARSQGRERSLRLNR